MKIDLASFSPSDKPIPLKDDIIKWSEYYKKIFQRMGYDENEHDAMSKISKYCARYYAGLTGEYKKPNKSLLLFGPCGTGKTMAMQILSGIFNIEFVSACELMQIYETSGSSGFWREVREYRNEDIILDDLGFERDVKHYGNSGIMLDFLADREVLYKKNNKLTFITTNIKSRHELSSRYGDRIMSRIIGMCKPMFLGGNDRRIIDGVAM